MPENLNYQHGAEFKAPKRKGLNPDYQRISPINLDASGNIPILDAAERLAQKMVTDSLTKCYTLGFYEKYKAENFDPIRDDNQIGIVFIDINNFKDVNDQFGHDKGDEELLRIAEFLKVNFRKGDEVIRIGGDEFIIICRNHNNDQDFEQHLMEKVASICEKYNGLAKYACGVAVFKKEIDNNLDDTKRRADLLMYQNKAKMKQ